MHTYLPPFYEKKKLRSKIKCEKVTVLECEDINKAVSELETSAADAVVMDEICAKYFITKGKQLLIAI